MISEAGRTLQFILQHCSDVLFREMLLIACHFVHFGTSRSLPQRHHSRHLEDGIRNYFTLLGLGVQGSLQKLQMKAWYCKEERTISTYDTWTCQANTISIDGFSPVRLCSYTIQRYLKHEDKLLLKSMKKQIAYTPQFSRNFHTRFSTSVFKLNR